MNALTWGLWIGYAALLVWLSRSGIGRHALAPGRVSVIVQAFAYVATYVSAVALVGFAGLCHRHGLQMLLIAAGNVWFGVWFVYRFLAWPTRLHQRRLGAKTPAELLSRAYNAPMLQPFLGGLCSALLVVYGSAVLKGAALMLSGALSISVTQALVLVTACVSFSVIIGGLRAVLYTEAFQGMVMVAGVFFLLFAALRAVGGPIEGLNALAALPPVPTANRGFLALSGGEGGMSILFLAFVTSIGVWAQPQLIQRHFALENRHDARRVIPIAMLAMAVVVGGAYFVGGLSRLLLGGQAISPDDVIPKLTQMLLPEVGRQLFSLAIVSASLSTATALLHVSAAGIGHDVVRRKLDAREWRAFVLFAAVASGVLALKSSSLIAWICATSWSLVACAILVPYLALLAGMGRFGRGAAWASSVGGLAGCVLWYAVGYASTSVKMTGLSAPGLWGALHPLAVGLFASAIFFTAFALVPALARKRAGDSASA